MGTTAQGQEALLEYLMHKGLQLRARRLQRAALAGWTKAARARAIDRLLLQSVEQLYAERLAGREWCSADTTGCMHVA